MDNTTSDTDESDCTQSDNAVTTGFPRSSRRSLVKSIAAGAAVIGLPTGVTASAEVVSHAGMQDGTPVTPQQRVFDPIWYSPEQDYWKGVTRTEPSGKEYEGAALLRGTLTLNEIYSGNDGNMFLLTYFHLAFGQVKEFLSPVLRTRPAQLR